MPGLSSLSAFPVTAIQAMPISDHSEECQLPTNITVCARWKVPSSGMIRREKLSLPMAKGAMALFGRRTGKAELTPYRAGDDNFFVSDEVSDSQYQARLEVCQVFRKLQFIEATGLLPADAYLLQRTLPLSPKHRKDPRSPAHHQYSAWATANGNRAVILVERSFTALQIKQDERLLWADTLAWAHDNKCLGIALDWAGLFALAPDVRTFAFISSDARYELDALKRSIEQIPGHILPANWDELQLL